MTIFLRKDLTARIIDETYGDIDGLIVAWEERASGNSSFPRPRSRAAVYRWLNDGVPTFKDGSDHLYFGLCGILDVDPLIIFDFHKNGFHSRFAKIRQLIYYGRQSLGGIATMLDMYRPGDIWPSEPIAQACYNHGWFGKQFDNRANWKCTDYILLKAKFQDGRVQHPRAVHIAYRRIGVPDTMWRFYGSVLAIGGQPELYNESGKYWPMKQVVEDEIRFRTYFGGRPVEWRIASLHDFTIDDREFPCNDDAIIGFTW